jgi:hypothetical protein
MIRGVREPRFDCILKGLLDTSLDFTDLDRCNCFADAERYVHPMCGDCLNIICLLGFPMDKNHGDNTSLETLQGNISFNN